MTARQRSHAFRSAVAYKQTEIPAALTIGEWRRLDAQQRRRRRRPVAGGQRIIELERPR